MSKTLPTTIRYERRRVPKHLDRKVLATAVLNVLRREGKKTSKKRTIERIMSDDLFVCKASSFPLFIVEYNKLLNT